MLRRLFQRLAPPAQAAWHALPWPWRLQVVPAVTLLLMVTLALSEVLVQHLAGPHPSGWMATSVLITRAVVDTACGGLLVGCIVLLVVLFVRGVREDLARDRRTPTAPSGTGDGFSTPGAAPALGRPNDPWTTSTRGERHAREAQRVGGRRR